MRPARHRYLDAALAAIETLRQTQDEAIARAAAAAREAVAADGLIYLFGTGHSHMMAEEGHYRAGGLACVVPILSGALMLHEGAVASTRLERMEGLAANILESYPIGPGDVVFVFSNSGVNAVPVEAVDYARARGARVVAVTSFAYSAAAANGRRRIADIADIAIDNGIVAGDASVEIADGHRTGPLSTVVGAAILNAILVDVAESLMAAGDDAPVLVSANMPGAAERNSALMARYGKRNRHL